MESNKGYLDYFNGSISLLLIRRIYLQSYPLISYPFISYPAYLVTFSNPHSHLNMLFWNRISRHPAISSFLPRSEHWRDKRVRLYLETYLFQISNNPQSYFMNGTPSSVSKMFAFFFIFSPFFILFFFIHFFCGLVPRFVTSQLPWLEE